MIIMAMKKYKKSNMRIVDAGSGFHQVQSKQGRGWQNRGVFLHKKDANKLVKKMMK